MPEISVIIPVYNVEIFLRECLDSILAQTFTDWEAICVNDGATDNSPAILAEYAAKDPRIKIVDQPNSGAGAARNNGMQHASGKYWMFLDSDDWFETSMFSEMFSRAENTAAEIAICRCKHIRNYDRACVLKHQFSYKFRSLPQPFSLKQHPEFFGTLNLPIAPWCYFYKADFIKKNNLIFQEIPRANDLYFTQAALVLAEKISLCDSCLVNYRVGFSTNLQSGNAKTPLSFLDALNALMEKIKSAGLYEIFESSFTNFAAALCLFNMENIRDLDACKTLYEHLQTNALKELGLHNREKQYFKDPDVAKRITLIRDIAFEDYVIFLISEAKRLRTENSILSDELQQVKILYHNALISISYKAGLILTAPLRYLKKCLLRKNDNA